MPRFAKSSSEGKDYLLKLGEANMQVEFSGPADDCAFL